MSEGSLMISNFLDGLEAFSEKIGPRLAIFLHFVFATVIFSPFIVSGQFIRGSFDNYIHHFVNMLFNLHTLQRGDLGLWNPYILCGVDFTASTHNFIHHPLNWFIFLFPEKYFFFLMTLRMFMEVWLLGVFAYLFFREELSDKKWALFSSTLYQLGGFVFFSITTYAALTILLFNTIALYVIWTLDRRKFSLSYVYLTLCFVSIILVGNFAYSFGALLTIAVLYVYRYWPDSLKCFPPTKKTILLEVSLITSVIISAARWLPFVKANSAFGAGGNFYQTVGGYSNHIYLGLTLFVPELFGNNLNYSHVLIQNINPGLSGKHAQFFGFPYFGALAVLLIFWAFLYVREKKINFWLVYVAVTSLWFLTLQPVSDFVDAIVFPVVHTIIPKMMLPIGFCALAGHIGKFLEANPTQENKSIKMFLAGLTMILGSLLMVYVYSYPLLIPYARILFITTPVFIFFGYRYLNGKPQLIEKAMTVYLLLAAVIFLFLMIAIGKWANNLFFISSFLYLSSSCVLSALVSLFLLNISWDTRLRRATIGFFLLATCFSVILLYFPFKPMTSWLPMAAITPPPGVWALAGLGSLRFVLMAGLFLLLLHKVHRRELRRTHLFFFFMLLAVVDLLPFNKAFCRQVTEPFFKGETLYPKQDKILTASNPQDVLVKKVTGRSEKGNLLINSSFESWSPKANLPPLEWTVGGDTVSFEKSESKKVLGKNSLAITHGGGDVKNLFQDVEFLTDLKDETFQLGAWVLSDKPKQVRLLLTDHFSGTFSPFHTGNGKWEWLAVTHRAKTSTKFMRPHICVFLPGTVYVDSAALVRGSTLLPTGQAEEKPSENEGSLVNHAFSEELDLKNYRVNNPNLIVKASEEEIDANIFSLYGVSSYGGDDSLVNQKYVDFARSFDCPVSATGGHFVADVYSDRFLDLVGCRYDVGKDDRIVIRPNALSRFMLFKDFEVIPDSRAAQGRLKDTSFNPLKTIILEKDPGISQRLPASPARQLEFTSQKTSILEVSVKSDSPAVILFNDSYNRYWKAYLNGKPQPVIRANFHFMATVVPPGNSQVVFKFKPKLFYKGFWITCAGFFLFWICWGFYRVGEKKYADSL